MRERGRRRSPAAAIGLGAGLALAGAVTAADPGPRCENVAVREIRPGMTFAEVREKLGTNGVTSRLREGGVEMGAIEYAAGGNPVYVLYDRVVDRKPADARVVLVRASARRRATDAAAILTERLGPPDDGSFDATGALATESATWVEPACGAVARVYRRRASWWAEAAEFVVEVESIDRAARRDAPEAATIAAAIEAHDKERETIVPPPDLNLALKIEESTPGAAAVSDPRPVVASLVAAKRIRYVPPEYPPAAKALGVRGNVVLLVTVADDGTVGEVRALSSQPSGRGFEEAAVKAARKWIYNPATQDGKPVASDVTVIVNFQ